MATLISPGVSVSVTDESITAGAGQGTVPFILIATASNKSIPDGTGTAPGTLPENAGRVYLITSQRELLQTFGDPIFQTVGGNSINGSPINEYGLLAAYSYLGLANRAYVVRADVDLSQLVASVIEPTSPMPVGTVWFDTIRSLYGIFEVVAVDANSGNPTYVQREVTVVFDGPPDNFVGQVNEYALSYVAGVLSYYKKNSSNVWELISVAHDYQASFRQPVTRLGGGTLTVGDVWVKTTPGAGGAAYSVSVLSSATGQYEPQTCPMFAQYTSQVNTAPGGQPPVFVPVTHTVPEQAAEFYGSSLSNGDFIVNAVTGTSTFTIERYQNGVWVALTGFEFGPTQPAQGPEQGAYWYNPDVGLDGEGFSTVDLLINNGTGSWENMQLPGWNYPGGTPVPGPKVYLQSANPIEVGITPANGDVWIDTAQINTYPVIFRWKQSTNRWILVDNTDQTTSNGILFADARPDPYYGNDHGENNGAGTAPDLDLGVPDPDAYPKGMLLWNTRFSTRNVKQWNNSEIVEVDVDGNPVIEGRWVNASGNAPDGSPYMGTSAQNAVVVKKLNEVLVSNDNIRSEFVFFNLIACPGYPEVIDEMITLNIDRKETGFIIGDTPFGLKPAATDLQRWATNANNAPGNGPDGLISADPYLGVYYPSGFATNTDGTSVMVPPSHMMLRTYAYNDQVAYPWFAPAGLTRGRISNAAAVGYLTEEGEFQPVTLNQGQRDTLYSNNINPIAFIPNEGLVAYGQKTRNPFSSAMSRVNVARLVNYIRYQSENIARPFLFEPNDKQTRDNVTSAFQRFLAELVTLRGLTDFLVVCDTSNNTPARIDRNELWIDLAIVPTKAIEFIYIPIRIRNTGSDLST